MRAFFSNNDIPLSSTCRRRHRRGSRLRSTTARASVTFQKPQSARPPTRRSWEHSSSLSSFPSPLLFNPRSRTSAQMIEHFSYHLFIIVICNRDHRIDNRGRCLVKGKRKDVANQISSLIMLYKLLGISLVLIEEEKEYFQGFRNIAKEVVRNYRLGIKREEDGRVLIRS